MPVKCWVVKHTGSMKGLKLEKEHLSKDCQGKVTEELELALDLESS